MRPRWNGRLGCPALAAPEPKVNALRRVLVPLATLLLLMIGLTACGDDATTSNEKSGSVTVTGAFGKEPKVDFDLPYYPGSTTTTVLTKGDGAKVEDGESVFANLHIANGYTGRTASSTWQDKFPVVLTDGADTIPGIRKALQDQTIGSRVEVQATPKDAYGEQGNDSLQIANDDPIVFVVDILSKVLDGVTSTPSDQRPSQPKIVQKDGKVTGLDFSKTAKKAPAALRATTLVKGDGPKVRKNSTIAVHYLGQVWNAKKAFDENYTKPLAGQPLATFVTGWQKTLPGVTVGSRVLLYVPPADGYGKKGNKDAGITGTDTMVFVVDILGVN